MPELPEVETIRRGLERVIVGKKIVKFESRDEKVVRFKASKIEGSEIMGIERRAKILIFNLKNSSRQGLEDMSLLIHLKMTGQLIWEECAGSKEFCLKKSRVAGGHPSADWVNTLPSKHTRAIFTFDDKSVLFYNDLRRFGWLKVFDVNSSRVAGAPSNNKYSSSGVEKYIPELAKLGPEPLSDDFTAKYMIARAKRVPNRVIKQFITDQEIISGVGNIYVDEALFYSGIMPTRTVKDIKASEWQAIRDNIRKALELGIKYGGSSEDTYVDAFGNQGTMNEHAKVYRKTGQPCPNGCGGTIQRTKLGGRGTHFCRSCQK